MNIGGVGDHARHGYDRAKSSSSFEWLTRIGFVSKGVVYIMIGVLALMAAFMRGGETTDQRGVIQRISTQPFGEFALLVIGVGLFAYALWRFVTAFEDTEGHGSSGKGLAKRAGYLFSGIAYAGIAFTALKVFAGDPGSGGDSTRTWTARLMDAPGGTLLVMLVGLAIVIAGLFQIRHGWKEKFREHLRTYQMSPTENKWTTRAGKWGYIARGIVFAIIGLFVFIAGLRHDPSRARGLEGALDTLASQAYGQWLLGFVAAGLACYGIYSIMAAKYRHINH